MRFFSTALLLAVMLYGCSSQPGRTLSDVSTTRVYAADKQQVFDAVRMHCLRENFKVDRFEQETGSIITHKTLGESGMRQDAYSPSNRLVVMHLRVREIAPGRTEAVTSFTFGNGYIASTRDDESILVDSYVALYQTMDGQLGPPRQESH